MCEHAPADPSRPLPHRGKEKKAVREFRGQKIQELQKLKTLLVKGEAVDHVGSKLNLFTQRLAMKGYGLIDLKYGLIDLNFMISCPIRIL